MKDEIVIKYEVWKVKNGKMDKLIKVFSVYEEGWKWILERNDSGSFILKYINK